MSCLSCRLSADTVHCSLLHTCSYQWMETQTKPLGLSVGPREDGKTYNNSGICCDMNSPHAPQSCPITLLTHMPVTVLGYTPSPTHTPAHPFSSHRQRTHHTKKGGWVHDNTAPQPTKQAQNPQPCMYETHRQGTPAKAVLCEWSLTPARQTRQPAFLTFPFMHTPQWVDMVDTQPVAA